MTTANLQIPHRGWGPFSPNHLGATRILGESSGSTLTIALHVARQEPAAVVIPDNIFGYGQNVATGERRTTIRAVPEDVAPDYSSFSLRYYLDTECDGDTALAHFKVNKDGQLDCELTFTNCSTSARRYSYGIGAVVDSPLKRIRLKEHLRPLWIAGKEYSDIHAYQRAFGMGCKACVSRAFDWSLEDSALAQAFGGWAEDRVSYRTQLPVAPDNAFLYFRYVKYGELRHPWEVDINGTTVRFEFPQTHPLPGGAYGKNKDSYPEWRLVRVPVGAIADRDISLQLRPIDPPGNDRARIWLDGILITDGLLEGDDGTAPTLPTSLCDEWLGNGPQIEVRAANPDAIELNARFPGEGDYPVHIATGDLRPSATVGHDSLNAALRKKFNLPPQTTERDARGNPWIAIETPFVEVAANASTTVKFSVAVSGCNSSASPRPTFGGSPLPATPSDQPYAEVAARLQDVLLFDVNYPFFHNGKPSPFVVPAKFFPIPYFWDGGIAALGMATVDPAMAAEQVNFFLAEGDTDYPFFSCGSPVPTQFYALWEVWQLSQDIPTLRSLYPGAKRMYDFFLGRFPGSVVNLHNDYMLSTYPYNYNLGLDDHPIQLWAEENDLTARGLYSIILLPQILRAARIMRNIAHLIGEDQDARQFAGDADKLAEVIDGQMWDEPSKLYGWLYRDKDGTVKPLKMPDGCAGDRSACTFLPLFGGLIGHKDDLIQHMEDTARFNTPFGISSVDRAAPTYNPNGYWNGGVWPIVQWFTWRGLLEAGEAERARSVATTILNTWQSEFKRAHYLGEHFILKDEKMSGTPNFAGLSSILLPMHAAYFKPFHVTTPFDAIIHNKTIDNNSGSMEISISTPFLEADDYTLLVNLTHPNTPCRVSINDTEFTTAATDEFGHLSLKLPHTTEPQKIEIVPDS